jgi:transcriptional regulator with XRE-family HTH domain
MTSLLKEHRKRAFLTTRELAEKAGVSPATIWRIERGEKHDRQPRVMRAIAGALGLHPSDIAEFVQTNIED